MKTLTSNFFEKLLPWLKNYWSSLLIILAIFGFVSKALYNYPVGVMAVLGLYRLLINPVAIWNDKTQRHFIILFLCLWVPLLLSFPDAYNQEHSADTVFPYLRFLFAGIFIIQELSANKKRLHFILLGVLFMVTFWCMDAVIQFLFGKDLFGFPYRPGDITGMFYPRNTISHICSILSTFCFLYVYQNETKRHWLWLLLIPLFFVVLLSGRRAAWIMLALSSFGFLAYIYVVSNNKKYILKLGGVILIVISIILSITIIFHKPTHDRFITTMGLFSTDYETIDKATALRLPIWETAINVFKQNPINGIGPRGFRHAYQEYTTPDNFWVNQTHPHLLILEVLAETGLIGFSGYLLLIFILVKHFLKSNRKTFLFPFFLPVVVAIFPFNAHMAFYGSIWSSMIWLLIAIYVSGFKLSLSKDL